LIPKIIHNALNNLDIPIYGDGSNIRDWLYVDDHTNAIDLVLRKGLSGESYNIGGNNEFTNNEIVNIICNNLDILCPRKDGKTYASQVKYVEDRLGHDKRYGIDATKIRKNLRWIAEESFASGIQKTIDWYIKKYK
jgi:dTDP-glucose 4,6-dehydratase